VEKREELLKFLAKRKLTVQQAIDILEVEVEIEKAKEKNRKRYETAVLPNYEKR
jgi:hypothetical protein